MSVLDDIKTNPIASLIADAIVAAVGAVIRIIAHTGVSESDLRLAQQEAIRKIGDIDAAEEAAKAREWRIARGLE